uniref:Uncharacterized protein AlNc14C141G7266 n=1 Tax=Albugo laibachii Nc14 TaxID=890382 RepID=F0WL78_9STRA|nr:conserved hypothetical protein [Albugo laibachii Nc14]|eukprot:CCA22039.1 conserved hypothetical protein [Albugo laibachii Nc14]
MRSQSEHTNASNANAASTFSIQAILNPVSDKGNQNGHPTLVARKRRGRRALLPKMSSSERGRYYRQKSHAYYSELEHKVDELEMHVRYLMIVRDLRLQRQLAEPHLRAGSLEKIVREYLTLFRNGLNTFARARTSFSRNKSLEVPIAFMSAFMSSDIRFGDFHGIDVILNQWYRYSTYFSLIKVDVVDVDITETEHELIVRARNTVRTRFSRETIKMVFPHAMGNESLVRRLIGAEVVNMNHTRFYFQSDGKIHRLDVDPDYMTALYNVLGNMEDVAFLLRGARMAQSFIGDMEAYRSRSTSPCSSPAYERFELLDQDNQMG